MPASGSRIHVLCNSTQVNPRHESRRESPHRFPRDEKQCYPEEREHSVDLYQSHWKESVEGGLSAIAKTNVSVADGIYVSGSGFHKHGASPHSSELLQGRGPISHRASARTMIEPNDDE